MKRFGALLSLLLALALLPLGALAQDDLAGRWSGLIGETTATLFLGEDGTLVMISDDADGVESKTGTWSQEPGILLLNYDGDTTRLQYTLDGALTAWEEGNEAEKATLDRAPWLPPESLAGEWEGSDSSGAFRLSLGADNAYTLSYLSGETISAGRFADYKDTLYMAGEDGSQLIFGYYFTDTGLTIVNQSNRSAFPLTRPDAPAVTYAPLPTDAPPAVTDAPLPTDTPPIATEAPVPAGLQGTWRGTDAAGEHTVTFGADGAIVRTYTDPANAGLNRRGFYIFNENTILITVPEVETQQLRYLLLGDSLLLSDMSLQNPVTFTRVTAPPPPQGLGPAFLGTWAGYGENGYFEFTFSEGSAYRKLVLPDETLSGEGAASFANGVLTLARAGGAETYDVTLSGDTLAFGGAIAATKQSGPLAREPLPEAQAAAGLDPGIAGVWGGMAEGRYQEFAFLPDGRFLGFSPLADPEQDSGNYLASGGSLAILSLRDTAQGTYALEGDRLTLSLSGREPFTLQKKDGLLRRTAQPAPQP